MVDIVAVGFGLFLSVAGALTAVNHRSIDSLNRWLKSTGTKQRPADVEMSAVSVGLGRLSGVILAVIGVVIVATGF